MNQAKVQRSSWGTWDSLPPLPPLPSIPLSYYYSKLKRDKRLSLRRSRGSATYAFKNITKSKEKSPSKKKKKSKSPEKSILRKESPIRISYTEYLKSNPTSFPDPNCLKNN